MTLRQRTRRLRHGLLWLCLRLLFAVIACLPLKATQLLGRILGRSIALFAFRLRKQVQRQIDYAGLQKDLSSFAYMADMGQRVLELVQSHKALPLVQLSPQVLEMLRSPRPRLAACLHLGHWELMGAAIARITAVHAIAAHAQTGPIFRFLQKKRKDSGIQIHYPQGGARSSLRALQQNQLLLMFIDQSTDERSRKLPFFGHDAPVSLSFERMIRLSGADPCLLWNQRQPDGRYLVQCEPLCPQNALEQATRRAEALIRQTPEQWVWNHDRWKERKHP